MLPDLLGLAVAAAVLYLPFVIRRMRAGRVQTSETARPAAPPPRPAAEGRVQPGFVPVSARVPYDDGPLIGGPS
jgi:hypothetical protein